MFVSHKCISDFQLNIVFGIRNFQLTIINLFLTEEKLDGCDG